MTKTPSMKRRTLTDSLMCPGVALAPSPCRGRGVCTNPPGAVSWPAYRGSVGPSSHPVFLRSSFCLKSHDHALEGPAPEARRPAEPQQLKAKRLREYTIQSHNSTPPNNTYANFERFARVVEEVGLMEAGLTGVAGAHRSLQGDVDALLSIYSEKEAWYKQEGESARKQLSQVRYEFRKVESARRLLQEDVRALDTSLEGLGARYQQRQGHLGALREEVTAELRWLQEVTGPLHHQGAQAPGGLTQGSSSLGYNSVNQALKSLLSHACGEALGPGDQTTAQSAGH